VSAGMALVCGRVHRSLQIPIRISDRFQKNGRRYQEYAASAMGEIHITLPLGSA